MFNKQNFCHIASNNRNEVKVGVFVYKTTDDLATVTTSGYFNDKIVDINLHDLIIHEWHDATDRTKVQRNILCVTERTLDNVGTQIIKTDWEEQTDETLEQLATDISGKVSKSGDTMTNPLKFILLDGTNSHGAIGAYLNGVALYAIGNNDSFDPIVIADKSGSTRAVRAAQSNSDLGNSSMPWRKLFVQTINNGSDLAVPNPGQADTLGLKSEIDLAANSGSQLTNKGVWFAKMYAATTVPTGAEYDGKNYADFSQVDGNSDPIIVLYEGQSGAWVQTQTITPPADYNGYVTVTSKIWDIVEQAGQQGGKVLWSHNTKTFTPYPQIISFEDINVTGNSTVAMPVNPGNTQIVNKNYVDNAIAAVAAFDLFDYKWRDATTSNTAWALSDGNWINKADAETAYEHLTHDAQAAASQISYPFVVLTGGSPYGSFVRAADFDETGADYPYAYANVTNGVLTLRYSTSNTGASDVAYYDGPSTGSLGWTVDNSGLINMQPTKFETIAGTTVMYWVASDGHKIVVPAWRPSIEIPYIASGQDTAVAAIYTATGVAWYYVLDTVNQRFKLPRALPFTGAVIGNGYSTAWSDGTNTYGTTFGLPAANSVLAPSLNGANLALGTAATQANTGYDKAVGLSTDPTKSGIIAERGATDQYKYLYFYVGQ